MPDITLRTTLGYAWENHLPADWKAHLAETWCDPHFKTLALLLELEYQQYTILPESGLIFNAFTLTPFDQVKVVVLGQDPYPDPALPHGLAFAVRSGVRIPLLTSGRHLPTPDRTG